MPVLKKTRIKKKVAWHEKATRRKGRHNKLLATCPLCKQKCRSLSRHQRRNCPKMPGGALNLNRTKKTQERIEEIRSKSGVRV